MLFCLHNIIFINKKKERKKKKRKKPTQMAPITTTAAADWLVIEVSVWKGARASRRRVYFSPDKIWIGI